MKKSAQTKFHWTIKDTIALLVIPLEFLLGRILTTSPLHTNIIVMAVAPFVLKLISIIIIISLFRKLLAADWQVFRKYWWLKLLICGAGAWVMSLILRGTRTLIGLPQSAEILESVTNGLPIGVFLLTAFTPVLAPITEEVVFRHVLFFKFKNIRLLRIVMFFVSAFLFGAIHVSHFGGNLLLTVPYMVIALCYNLVYFFTKNIWFSTATHFIFNFVQSVVPTIQVLILAASMP